MAYASWSVVFGEQPTASKWNELGANDAHFYSFLGDNLAWSSYTPTLTGMTLSNGSIIGRYTQVGKTVFFRVEITFGSSTTLPTGADNKVSVPVAINTTGHSQYFSSLGTGGFKISSTNWIVAPYYFDTNTLVVQGLGTTLTGTAVAVSTNNFGSPGTGSILQIQGFYQAA